MITELQVQMAASISLHRTFICFESCTPIYFHISDALRRHEWRVTHRAWKPTHTFRRLTRAEHNSGVATSCARSAASVAASAGLPLGHRASCC